ncbi:hypothetical protein [Legionella tucsonensis]|uniref:Uncharacterized protein n=1 Tax=Legionella tucsonensis TaxID=40335 RepID=A0A0W0ZTV5_9GAMM|nr:hypothetical protein [Legionella tucsonensis]KTD72615.1 hypothetical protein Ltuc_0462 [Legionella tucsonensis]
MDNKNIGPLLEAIDEQIDGIVIHLLKKYSQRHEFSLKFDAHLHEENEAETLTSSI